MVYGKNFRKPFSKTLSALCSLSALCFLSLSLSALFEQNPSHPHPQPPSADHPRKVSRLRNLGLRTKPEPPPTTLCRSPRKVSKLLRSGLLDEASRSGASRRRFAVGFATTLRRSGASSIWASPICASPIWASRWASQRGGLWVRWVCGVRWDCGCLL
jgi:hypothetical protein